MLDKEPARPANSTVTEGFLSYCRSDHLNHVFGTSTATLDASEQEHGSCFCCAGFAIAVQLTARVRPILSVTAASGQFHSGPTRTRMVTMRPSLATARR